VLLPLVLLFIVVPIVEIYVIIQVGQAIGALWTIALLVADSIIGSMLMRSQGRTAWRRFNEAIDLDSVQSTGYVFQTDMVVRCLRRGLRVREVPIEFIERVRGDSKMSGQVAAESLRRITAWGLRERRDQLTRWRRGPA